MVKIADFDDTDVVMSGVDWLKKQMNDVLDSIELFWLDAAERKIERKYLLRDVKDYRLLRKKLIGENSFEKVNDDYMARITSHLKYVPIGR